MTASKNLLVKTGLNACLFLFQLFYYACGKQKNHRENAGFERNVKNIELQHSEIKSLFDKKC